MYLICLYLGSAAEQTKETVDHASNVASQKTNQVCILGAFLVFRSSHNLTMQAAAGAREAKKDFEKEVRK